MDVKDKPGEAAELPPTADTPKKLTPHAITAIQGNPSDEVDSTAPVARQNSEVNSTQKGSDFEQWVRQNLFKDDQARRIVIHSEDNPHLGRLGGGLSISKEYRVTEAYWKQDSSIWELKAGYPNKR